MAQHYGPHIVTDGLKLLIDPKDDVCNGGKSVMTDLTGNLNSGSIYSGAGLNFDGVDDYVQIPRSSSWQSFLNSDFTFSIWAKFDDDDVTDDWKQQIWTTNWDGSGGYVTFVRQHIEEPYFTILFRIYAGGSDIIDIYSTTVTTTGKWYYITVTRSANDYKIYIDGSLENTETVSTTWPTNLHTDGIFFTSWFAEQRFNNCKLSDFKIFNTALSAADVSQLYNKPNTVLPGAVSGSQLVGWWPLTEGAGTVAYDGSGNGISGSLAASGSSDGPTWVSGSADIPQLGSKGFSKKMVFDGSDDYVSIADSDNWDIVANGAAATIALWLRFNTHAGEDYIIAQREDGSNYWALRHSDGSGGFHFQVYNGSTIVDSGYQGEVEDSDWHHIAMTKDASDNYTLYKDGDVIGSFSDSSDDTFSGPLNIGVLNPGAEHFDGLIDEVAIWNINLSTGSLQDISNKTSYGLPNPTAATEISSSNLVGYWRNGGTELSGSWQDLSGNGNHGYISGLPSEIIFSESHIKGRDSQGMPLSNPNEGWFELNSTSGSISNNPRRKQMIFSTISTDFNFASSSFAVESWINQSTILYAEMHIIGIEPAGDGPGWWLHTSGYGNGRLQFYWGGYSDGLIRQLQTSNGVIGNINQWYHTVASCDYSEGTVKLYVDGNFKVSLAINGGEMPNISDYLTIGANNHNNGNYRDYCFAGKISSVKAYNTALSDVEVSQNYNAQRGRFGV